MTKHFFATITLFTAMIMAGLLAIFLISHFGIAKTEVKTEAKVAK